MATGTTALLTFPIEPGVKETLHAAAQHELRYITKVVELLLQD